MTAVVTPQQTQRSAAETPATESGEDSTALTIRLDITTTVGGTRTMTTLIDHAKKLIEAAKPLGGTVRAEFLIGRQKLPIA